MEETRLVEWADKLKALRERKDELEAELKQVNMDIDNADWHLSNLMAEKDTKNFICVRSIHSPSLRPFSYAV